MAEKTASLDIAILPPASEGTAATNTDPANCDFDYFNTFFRTLNFSTDVYVGSAGETVSLMNLMVVDDTVFVLFVGGLLDEDTTNTASDLTEKYEIATDVVTSSLVLSTPRYDTTAAGNARQGIIAGGAATGTGASVTTIDSYFYELESLAPNIAVLSNAKQGSLAVSDADRAVIAGGENGSAVDTIESYDYATNTIETLAATLTLATARGAGVGNNQLAYFVGGAEEPGSTRTDLIERFDFLTDTLTVESIILGAPRYRHTGISDGNEGLIIGGDDGTLLDTIDEIVLLTGQLQTLSTTLGSSRTNAAAGGDFQNGVIGGGGPESTGTVRADTETFDFDTLTIQTGTSLGTARKSLSALSSSPGFLFPSGIVEQKANLDMQILTVTTLNPVLDVNVTV